MDATLHELTQRLRAFADARDWQKFHSPKNLVMALSVESAELMEHFQWLTEQQSLALTPAQREEVALEMADVLLYLLRLADCLDVDLMNAAARKIGLNEEKYPPEQVRGSSTKRRRD
jgi:dCTP diphosphatase